MQIPFLDRIMNTPSNYPSHTVESVDLQQFAGKWYELASFPSWFERGCNCSTAEYTVKGDHLQIKNSCLRNGRPTSMKAKAYPVPDSGNAQLKVQYLWPLKGDYWIVARDEDYQYAVVGHPKKKYLWILSRSPSIDEELYQSLVEMARRSGYDVSRLRRTNQICNID